MQRPNDTDLGGSVAVHAIDDSSDEYDIDFDDDDVDSEDENEPQGQDSCGGEQNGGGDIDNDSTLGDEEEDTTVELGKMTNFFITENYRKYHKEYRLVAYPHPSDGQERRRLRRQHLLLKKVLKKPYMAPISPEQLQRVLDLGTGTGDWAIELADRYKNALVYGLDLSPIQPKWVPPNVHFIVDNIEEEFIDKKIDFVFARNLPVKNWQSYMENIFDCLRPGGWAEIQFLSWKPITNLSEKTHVEDWASFQAKAMQKAGFVTMTAVEVKELMRSTGFSEVQEQTVTLPMCGEEIDPHLRRLSLKTYAKELEAISLALFYRHLEWSRDEAWDFLASVRQEMEDPKTPFSWPFHIVYGQRPEE